MKRIISFLLFYLVCFLGLLTFFGCGSDTEDTEKASGLIAERPEPEKTDDIYIPDKWYKTRDPLLRNDYFLAVLIKQFGDIPEVHTVGEYNLDVVRGEPLTLSKIEAYLEANYHLFPNEKTKKAIEDFKELKASGAEIGVK